MSKLGFKVGKRVLVASVLGIALSMMQGQPAEAATATANLAVSANVNASCTISALPLTFPNYDTSSLVDTDGTGTVSVTCTNGSAVVVTLDQGAAPAGGSTAAAPMRQMVDGANVLGYDLYSDAGRTTAWGDTAGTGMARTGTGAADALTVYGRIPAMQPGVVAGLYGDTVVATVTY